MGEFNLFHSILKRYARLIQRLVFWLLFMILDGNWIVCNKEMETMVPLFENSKEMFLIVPYLRQKNAFLRCCFDMLDAATALWYRFGSLCICWYNYNFSTQNSYKFKNFCPTLTCKVLLFSSFHSLYIFPCRKAHRG